MTPPDWEWRSKALLVYLKPYLNLGSKPAQLPPKMSNAFLSLPD